MPDNKLNDRLKRIRVIDELFSSNPGTTYLPEEIIERVINTNADKEYNRFKLARDIAFLKKDGRATIKEEKAHPNINEVNEDDSKSYKHQGGRKITKYGYVDQDSSIFKDSLTLDDKKLIINILDILKLKGLESLQTFVKFEKNHGHEASRDYSPIISFTKNPDEGRTVSRQLNKLLPYIRQKSVLKIRMQDRFGGEDSDHVVHPWYLREYNRRWYLFGSENGVISHYSLDRMKRISKLENKHYISPTMSIDEILQDVIGVSLMNDDPVEEIVFWVSNKSSDFVLKKPLHSSMTQISIDNAALIVAKNGGNFDFVRSLSNSGGVFCKVACKINYELKREMMSFNKELIVLAPKKLREDIIQTLTAMLSNYND